MITKENDLKDDLIQGLSDDVVELSKKEIITKEKILECEHDILMRFDKESNYRELGESTARNIVSGALNKLINELGLEK